MATGSASAVPMELSRIKRRRPRLCVFLVSEWGEKGWKKPNKGKNKGIWLFLGIRKARKLNVFRLF